MMIRTSSFYFAAVAVVFSIASAVAETTTQDSKPENSRELWESSTQNPDAVKSGTPAARFAEPASWDKLSAEILPRYFECNSVTTDMAMIREARCMIDISATAGTVPPVKGTLSYAWKDADNNGILTPDEITVTITDGDKQTLEPYRKQFEMQALCHTTRVLLRSTITTARQENGFLVTITPGPVKDALELMGLAEMRCTVSPDLCMTNMTTRNTQGVETFSRFQSEKIGGKWYAVQSTRRMAMPGAGMVTETAKSRYTAVDGATLNDRMTIETEVLTPSGETAATMQQVFVFRDWHIVKRNQPLELPRVKAVVTTAAARKPIPTPVQTGTVKPPTPARKTTVATESEADSIRVDGMEKFVSPEARFVVYKPKGWKVRDGTQQNCLLITVNDPKNEYGVQFAYGLNPAGSAPVDVARALIAGERNQYADYQLTRAYASKDGHTIVFDTRYAAPQRGPREGRSWIAANHDSFTLARCEAPAGRFEQSRRVLLSILMNIQIIQNTIPATPKVLPLSQYRLSDGSASFSLPQGWSIEHDFGKGFFVAKDRSGLGSFTVSSVEVLSPQLGVTVPGVPVLPYLAPHKALAALADFQGILKDIRFVEVVPRNDVAKLISQVYTVGPVQTEECISTYRLHGTPCKSYTFGISFGSRLNTGWRFNHMSIGAPAAEFDALVPTLTTMMASYKIDDDFAMRYIANGMARLRRMQQETAAIIAKNRQEISSMMQAAYDERQRSQDWIDYQRTNYIRGQTDWISGMEGGAVYHTDSWGTQNTYTGERWDGAPFNYVNFEGRNPKYNETMTPIDNRKLYEQVFRR